MSTSSLSDQKVKQRSLPPLRELVMQRMEMRKEAERLRRGGNDP